MAEKAIPEAQLLLERYGDCLTGLIHYGSTAFGRPRRDSARDFWLIVSDLWKFHRRFKPPPDRFSGVPPPSAAARVRLNRYTPNFYGFLHNGVEIKLAVVDEEVFCRWCCAKSFYVKGRMQKPLRVIRANERILTAVHAARTNGVRWALDLLPAEFDFETFLYTLLSLSYMAEIRPEITSMKIQSIIDTGRDELEAIYRPLLASYSYVAPQGERYRDVRRPAAKRRAKRAALRELQRLRWHRDNFGTLYRNYRTYPHPIRYLLRKVLGELWKGLRRPAGAWLMPTPRPPAQSPPPQRA